MYLNEWSWACLGVDRILVAAGAPDPSATQAPCECQRGESHQKSLHTVMRRGRDHVRVTGVRVGKPRKTGHRGGNQSKGGNAEEFAHDEIQGHCRKRKLPHVSLLPQHRRQDNWGWATLRLAARHPNRWSIFPSESNPSRTRRWPGDPRTLRQSRRLPALPFRRSKVRPRKSPHRAERAVLKRASIAGACKLRTARHHTGHA